MGLLRDTPVVVEPRPFVAIVVIQVAASALVELFTSSTSLEWLLPAVIVVVIAVVVVVIFTAKSERVVFWSYSTLF